MTEVLLLWAILATMAAIIEASKTVTFVLRVTKLEHLVRATRQRADNAERAAEIWEERALAAESMLLAPLESMEEP